MSELRASLSWSLTRWVLTAASGGAGVALGIAAIDALKLHPEFLPQLVNGGGLWFAALALAMLVFRGELRNFNATQERNAVAQELLAANVGALVLKDELHQREQELTVNHLSRQSEEILRILREKKCALEP